MPQDPPETQRHGIEGKWTALNDENVELKEQLSLISRERDELSAQLATYTSSDVADLMKRVAAAAVEVQLAREQTVDSLIQLTDEEQEAMDSLMTSFNIVGNRWKLRSNQPELVAAVHTIQGFIQQHMLSRIAPQKYGNWWAQREGE